VNERDDWVNVFVLKLVTVQVREYSGEKDRLALRDGVDVSIGDELGVSR
jgi:hypothetical protein